MKITLDIFKENEFRKWERLEKVYNCKHDGSLPNNMRTGAAEPGRDFNVSGYIRFV